MQIIIAEHAIFKKMFRGRQGQHLSHVSDGSMVSSHNSLAANQIDQVYRQFIASGYIDNESMMLYHDNTVDENSANGSHLNRYSGLLTSN